MSTSRDLETTVQESILYINPPLSPQSVRTLIEHAQTTLEEDILDVVFEPKSNCFRFTVYTRTHKDVLNALASHVDSLHHQDASDADGAHGLEPRATEDTVDTFDSFTDGIFFRRNQLNPARYGNSLYPRLLHSHTHKAIWYGAQEAKTTLSQLFQDGERTWLGPYLPKSLDTIGTEWNCEVTWNVPETVLYIGAEQLSLSLVLQRLDLLHHAVNLTDAVPKHVIAAAKDAQLGCRSLEMLCLDRKILCIDHLGQPIPDLPSGASLRLALFSHAKDMWITDTTKYKLNATSPSSGAGKSKPTKKESVGSLLLANEIQLSLRALADLTHSVPGLLRLELIFGRVWLTNIEPTELSVQGEPNTTWRVDRIERDLNNPRMDYQDSFSPVLTTSSDDIILLRTTTAPGHPRWAKSCIAETTVYIITCGDGHERFQLHVSEDQKTVARLSMPDELAGTAVHFPEAAWDMKLRAIRRHPLSMSPEGRAQRIAEEMIADGREDDATVRFPKAMAETIKSVSIVHTKSYPSRQNNSSLLEIKTTQRLCALDTKDEWHSFGIARKPDVSMPTKWVEASITSTILVNALSENASLEFGETPTWSVTEVESRGAFADICGPALAMIANMDNIGLRNVHQNAASRKPLRTAQKTDGAHEDIYHFW